ncbi:MAG: site-2 protease family protein [Candidatus Eremiobacteraeota bacterium]|nr:site-2 protease family protein [Candidatus Eremiobacteraeota bacterium]MBC5826764.1 site-2 protease family protein [Candidatus Eremiobacteraeota bacterium]
MRRRWAWRAGSIWGIDIVVHPSWLVIYGIFAASAMTAAGIVANGLGKAELIVLGLTVSLFLFASVVVHEFAHAAMARRQGIATGNITLFLFGGVATILSEPARPRDEVSMAAAGPIASIVLGALFLGAYELLSALGLVAASVFALLLGYSNCMLALFNLLPAFPSDGGRILRAVLWHRLGSRGRATALASRTSLIIAGVLVAAGLYFVGPLHMMRGLWTIAIALFLAQAALGAGRQAKIDLSLERMRVGDCMMRDLARVPATTSIASFFADFADRSERGYAIVEDGSFLGLLSTAQASIVSPALRQATPVTAVMTPAYRTPGIDAAAPAGDALNAMALNRVRGLPVVENGDLTGIISADTIHAALRRAASGGRR